MKIYLVGGAVRDQLLGLNVKDNDYLVVGATPEQLLAQGYQSVGKDFPVFLHPKTKQEYAELLVDYRNAKSSLDSYREHYVLYQDNYALAMYKYKHDVYSTDQLLQVYGEKLRSQNRYIYAMGNYYISRSLIQLKNQFAKPENNLPYE